MQRISSLMDTRDDDYRANHRHNRRLAFELRERQQAARHVRPERRPDGQPGLDHRQRRRVHARRFR